MNLSNGTVVTFGQDYLGSVILLDGNIKPNTLTESVFWSRWQSPNKDDKRRFWRLPKKLNLKRVSNNCPKEYFEFLKVKLDSLSVTQLHPALVNGFHSEAKRLFPEISEKSNNLFVKLISKIKTKYSIEEDIELDKEKTNFVDDIGPSILTLIDDEPSILPEIPKVYSAPKNWLSIMWNINNHMVGPLINMGLPDEEIIQFQGLELEYKNLSSEEIGLYYIHMSRFILFFEAWTGNIETPYLNEFIRLIEDGIDPLAAVIHK